ncbi:MAG: hypothetical protein ACOZAK_02125 [Patescibacteria group bacterium]
MLEKLLKFIEKNLLWLIIGLYLLITLPALFDPNHFLFNLEPYPDGILYALSGKNFWLGNGLKLIFEFGEKTQWVPPIYSMLLGLPALFFVQPIAFYLMNILIGVGFLSVFYWLLTKTTKNKLSQILAMLILLSHSLLFFLPTIPMTENLTLLFFTTIITSFFIDGYKKYTLLTLAFIGALFTRYSILPIIMAGILIIPLLFLQKVALKKKLIIIFFTLALFLLALLFLSLAKINAYSFLHSVMSNSSSWQGTRFIYPNFITYYKMLLFNKGLFLWLNVGLTNFIFFGLFLASWVVMWKKKLWPKFWILTVLFIAQLPLQLVFYVADARYLIYTLPLVVLGVAWLVDALPEKKKLLIPLAIFGIVLQLFMQRTLVKQIIADNLLGKSTAWQYEAILHFNNNLNDGDLLITALPPFLVDTYQTKAYRVLPLSYTQEFMNKKQYLWGNDLNYEDLLATYQSWLDEDKTVYISNAYITHHQNVIKDFETYKQNFSLILIANGCEQACNIYQLQLKP